MEKPQRREQCTEKGSRNSLPFQLASSRNLEQTGGAAAMAPNRNGMILKDFHKDWQWRVATRVNQSQKILRHNAQQATAYPITSRPACADHREPVMCIRHVYKKQKVTVIAEENFKTLASLRIALGQRGAFGIQLSSEEASLLRPDGVWTRRARPRQGWEFADCPCRGPLRGGPAAPAAAPGALSPGSRAAGSGLCNPAPRRHLGPSGTAAGGRSQLLPLPKKEVRDTGSGGSRTSSPSPRGGLRGAGSGLESPHRGRRGQALPLAAPRPAGCVGAPAVLALLDPGVKAGARLEAPTCPGQPLPRETAAQGRWEGGMWAFNGLLREALVVRAGGEHRGMADAGRLRERRAHTRAHTPESMLSAALGTSCRVESCPGPLPAISRPADLKVGGGGAREWEGVRRSLWCFRTPGPCFAFSRLPELFQPTAPAAGNLGVDVISSSRGQLQGLGWSEAWRSDRYQVDPPTVRLPRARNPHGKQIDRRGCEPRDVRAHTRCAVTHKAVVS
ncbi:hypothetical protein J0S82_017159 [Galemys pyrenaicus]|uniref:Uncharacterized protein n=1 Tax=Galemys pyrenaicus TaxID=202257 RepID=A0A8J6DPA3_GALPY|nr:hypothetical protein J0S82_017159 [Galemys pyrenaicus]